MNELAAKIVLDPPSADVVLVFSASWFVWVGIFLVLTAIVAAFWPKKPAEPDKPAAPKA